MKLKTLFLGLACGFLLSACGGIDPAQEESTPSAEPTLSTSQQGICEGWDAGARRCSYKCTSTSEWRAFAAYTVAYGDCVEAGTRACGRVPYGSCWSI